jgi:D-inositol-3-phosphate glycosyltransferase
MAPNDSTESAGQARAVRVLYSCPRLPGDPGIGAVAGAQLRGLVAAGFEVTVYAAAITTPVPGTVAVQTLAAGSHRIPRRALGSPAVHAYHDARVAHALAARPYAYDIVHTWPRACLRTLRTAARVGVPGLRELDGPASRPARAPASRDAAERAAAAWLLAPTDEAVRALADSGADASKAVRHAYGYDPTHVRPTDGPRPTDRPFTVVLAGGGRPDDGLRQALRAWREAGAPGQLLVHGNLPASHRKRIAPLFEVAGVIMAGAGDLADLLRGADAVVLPSTTGGTGTAVLAAAACGCVPLVPDGHGAPARHLIDGLVHPAGDVETLAGHLRMLADDPGLLAKLREAAIAAGAARTWERAGDRLADIYRALRRIPAPLPGETTIR